MIDSEMKLSREDITAILDIDAARKLQRGLLIAGIAAMCLAAGMLVLFRLMGEALVGNIFGGTIGIAGAGLIALFFYERNRTTALLGDLASGDFIVFSAKLHAIRTWVNTAGEIDSYTDYLVFSLNEGARTFKWHMTGTVYGEAMEVGKSYYVLAFRGKDGTYCPTQFYLYDAQEGFSGIDGDLSAQYTEDPPEISKKYAFYK